MKQADKFSVRDDTQCISVSVCLLWLGRGRKKLIAISSKLMTYDQLIPL